LGRAKALFPEPLTINGQTLEVVIEQVGRHCIT
jgi:hypothetical protein